MSKTDVPGPAQRPSARTALLSIGGVRGRLGGAARGAAAVALPAFAGLLIGHGVVATVSALGAFAVVYGERRPYRTRWRAVAGYGVALIVCAAAGAGLALAVQSWEAAARWAALVVLMTVVAVTAACWVDALRERAPGAFLLVLCAELAFIMIRTDTASATAIVGWTAVGVGSALLVTMSGFLVDPRGPEIAAVRQAEASLNAASQDPSNLLLRRHAVHDVHAAWDCLSAATGPGRRHRLLPEMTVVHGQLAALLHDDPDSAISGAQAERLELMPFPKPTVAQRLRWTLDSPRTHILAVRLTVACLLAGSVAILTGLPRPDWAVITAAMILHQGTDRVLGSWRGLHRCIGTVLGVGLLAALAVPLQHPIWLIVIVAGLMAGTEAFLVVNYAVAMVFITPLAMILGEPSAPVSGSGAVIARIAETLLGVGVALVVLWVVAPRGYRTVLRDAERRVARAVAAVESSSGDLAALNRRRLEYELRAAAVAFQHAGYSSPGWARAQWPAHHRLHQGAYELVVRRSAEQ